MNREHTKQTTRLQHWARPGVATGVGIAAATALLVSCVAPILVAPPGGGGSSPEPPDRAGLGNSIDILWVIDNSNSMASVQAEVRANMGELITGLLESEVDFQVGITTTDVTNPGNGTQGNIRSLGPIGGGPCQPPEILTPQSEDLLGDFQALVDVGVAGSGSETGILAAAYTLCKGQDTTFWDGIATRPETDPVRVICELVPPEQRNGACNNGFFRPGAGTLVLIVSDEGDDSYRNGFLPPSQWIDQCELEHNDDPFFGECDCRISWFLDFFASMPSPVVFATIGPTYQDSALTAWCDGSTVTLPGPCNEFGSDVCGIDFYQQIACQTGGVFSPVKSTTQEDDPTSCTLSNFSAIADQLRTLLDL